MYHEQTTLAVFVTIQSDMITYDLFPISASNSRPGHRGCALTENKLMGESKIACMAESSLTRLAQFRPKGEPCYVLLLLLLVCTPRSLGRLSTITRGRWCRGSTGSIGPVGPPGVLVAGLACIVGF